MPNSKKITLAQVKSLAKKGPIQVLLFPSKCGPGNTTWVRGITIDVNYIEDTKEFRVVSEVGSEPLQSYLNSYQYYNCNTELGNRVHFYLQES